MSAADDAVLSATGGRCVRFRVKVKDAGGTFRDLSSYAGVNFCLSADFGEDVDSPGMDADIVLKREVEGISLAPLKTASPLNRGLAYPGSYAKLIDVAREVQIEVAVIPDGSTPASGDWNLAFHGYIDDVDPGQGSHITLRCSDLQAKLRDTWIERERSYAFAQGANATKGCQYWRPSEAVALAVRGLPTEALKNGHYYRVTTAGTTGTTEPTWPTGGGATVADGTAVWTESGSTSETTGTAMETVMQQILDDNLGAGVVTLSCPVSPSFNLLPWKQDRTSVWDALRKLADLNAWDIRYKWDSGSSTFKLTLYTPDRAKTTPDRTFSGAQRYPLSRLATQVQWIRNVVQVVYNDHTDLDAQGNPKRKTVSTTDSTSVAAYGRRFCEVAEGATSPLVTSGQASALIAGMLSDLANPVAEHACELPLFRHAELADLYRWSADGLHYDTDQDLAVTKYRHGIDDTKARTTVETRGKPSAGMRRWHDITGVDQHALDLDNSSSVAVATFDVVGGTKIQLTPSTNHKNYLEQNYEIHVSATPGFTPGPSTLVSSGAKTEAVVPNLIPGNTYYTVHAPYGFNKSRIVRGNYSAQQSFTAGRASAGHINEGIALGSYPLNGGFENRLDTGGMPDQWTVSSGTFGTGIAVMEDGNGVSGSRYMRLTSGASLRQITSCMAPLICDYSTIGNASQRYLLTAMVKAKTGNSGSSNLFVTATGYAYDGTSIGAMGGSGVMFVGATSKPGVWQRVYSIVHCDGFSTMRGVKVNAYVTPDAAADVYDVDEVRLVHLGSPWFKVGDTTHFTDAGDSIPNFVNNSTNYDATNDMEVAFRRTGFNKAQLRGILKKTSGSWPAVAFTLPATFRPPRPMRFSVVSNSAFGQVDISTNGDVTVQIGSTAWVDLSGIEFETFY